ncbi:MAG: LPS export ABC transporter ATP-binding protein [Dissulfurimicrobium sp.]|uniref:LPS export ABC transporter ATP-binding protein n=1 Tax=Dissulfurimicrobium sp. TaxID=2022436 RepID=UPI00404A5FDA
MARLTTFNLVKFYGKRRIVNKICLEINDHSIVGLLGPNGAGKTTTFYMIAGLIRPDDGVVFLDDMDVTRLPMHERARRGITYLPQEPSVFRRLSVADNLRLVLEARGFSRENMEKRVSELLKDMGIEALADHMAQSLSGGERRRLEVLRALATDPRFILLDEPFAGVDPLAILDLQEIIVRLKDRGIGVFISDHNVRETLTVCDRAYILNEGTIVEAGAPGYIASSALAKKIYLGESFKL